MKHLIFTALFLLSYTVAVRAQIVFPTPNQVEMQTGNLILGKKVSMYAEDTTAFYLNLFREEVLSRTPIKWQKKESKADICWITDSSLPPEGYRHQKVYRHGFTAQNELLPLASDRRTGMAHRNQAISAPHPDWRFGRQRRRTAGILYTGRNTGYHRICPSTEYHHRPRNRYAGPCRSCSLCLSRARLFRIAGRDTAKRIYPKHILCRKRRNSPFPEKRTG